MKSTVDLQEPPTPPPPPKKKKKIVHQSNKECTHTHQKKKYLISSTGLSTLSIIPLPPT